MSFHVRDIAISTTMMRHDSLHSDSRFYETSLIVSANAHLIVNRWGSSKDEEKGGQVKCKFLSPTVELNSSKYQDRIILDKRQSGYTETRSCFLKMNGGGDSVVLKTKFFQDRGLIAFGEGNYAFENFFNFNGINPKKQRLIDSGFFYTPILSPLYGGYSEAEEPTFDDLEYFKSKTVIKKDSNWGSW
jgi:hypothetical protein